MKDRANRWLRHPAVGLSLLVLAAFCLAACAGGSGEPESTTTPAPTGTASPPSTRRPTPLPAPTATATQRACSPAEDERTSGSYLSPILAEEIPVHYFVPRCYRTEQKPPPTIYFFHGKPFDETHWPALGLTDRYAEGLRNRRWQVALLVFPNLPEPLFSNSDGGPNSYEQEFLEGLMPAVAAAHPGAGRGKQMLVGISRGGIWALEIGLRHPDQFGVLAGLSPSLAVNYPRSRYDPMQLAQGREELPGRVLLLAGEEDWARPKTEELASLLQGKTNVDLEVVPGDHSDGTWEASLPLLLDFLLAR